MLAALETTLQDVRYAIRGLLPNPAFSLTAILAGALGIGATSAVFSVVDRILFRALPYSDENRLVSVGMMAPLDTNEFLFADPYFSLRRDAGPFEQVNAFQAGTIATDLDGRKSRPPARVAPGSAISCRFWACGRWPDAALRAMKIDPADLPSP